MVQSGFHPLQAAPNRIVVVFAAPGIARNPSTAGFVPFCRVGIRSVVVDGANHHAPRPGSDSIQGAPLEIAAVIERGHIFHFSGMTRGNPLGKMSEFGSIGGGSDARQVETGIVGGALDDGF